MARRGYVYGRYSIIDAGGTSYKQRLPNGWRSARFSQNLHLSLTDTVSRLLFVSLPLALYEKILSDQAERLVVGGQEFRHEAPQF